MAAAPSAAVTLGRAAAGLAAGGIVAGVVAECGRRVNAVLRS